LTDVNRKIFNSMREGFPAQEKNVQPTKPTSR
jgi:hypothetical protein